MHFFGALIFRVFCFGAVFGWFVFVNYMFLFDLIFIGMFFYLGLSDLFISTKTSIIWK